MGPEHDTDQNVSIRAAIEGAGGLASLAGLARKWGVTKQRAAVLAKHPEFPAPIPVEGSNPVYLVDEANAFRASPRPPGPKKKRT